MIGETVVYLKNLEREFLESIELSGLSKEDFSKFLETVPFSSHDVNRFLKGEFHNGLLKFMYKEYLESIGK
jgi:hypothetical protein